MYLRAPADAEAVGCSLVATLWLQLRSELCSESKRRTYPRSAAYPPCKFDLVAALFSPDGVAPLLLESSVPSRTDTWTLRTRSLPDARHRQRRSRHRGARLR